MLHLLVTQQCNSHTQIVQHAMQQPRNNQLPNPNRCLIWHAILSQKDAQQAPQKQGEDVARVEELCAMNREKELTRLVRLVSDHEGFTETEHKEALEVALADPVNALTCFSPLARRIESLKQSNGGEKWHHQLR